MKNIIENMAEFGFGHPLHENFYIQCPYEPYMSETMLLIFTLFLTSSIGFLGCLLVVESQKDKEELPEKNKEKEENIEDHIENNVDINRKNIEENSMTCPIETEENINSSIEEDDGNTESELNEIIAMVRNSQHQVSEKVNDPYTVQEMLSGNSNNNKIEKLIDVSRKTKEALSQLASNDKKKQFINEIFTAFEETCSKLKTI